MGPWRKPGSVLANPNSHPVPSLTLSGISAIEASIRILMNDETRFVAKYVSSLQQPHYVRCRGRVRARRCYDRRRRRRHRGRQLEAGLCTKLGRWRRGHHRWRRRGGLGYLEPNLHSAGHRQCFQLFHPDCAAGRQLKWWIVPIPRSLADIDSLLSANNAVLADGGCERCMTANRKKRGLRSDIVSCDPQVRADTNGVARRRRGDRCGIEEQR